MITCVVIASSPYTRSVVEASLRSLGLQTRGASSLEELPVILKEVPAGGILLELVTSIKSSPQEKETVNELMRFYPFARFRLDGQEIKVLGDEKSLEGFALRCQRSAPRLIRRETRKSRHLAVCLSPDPRFEDPEKSVTINLSEGGCFVYSCREWKIGDCVWLRLPEDEAAVSGIVCFWHPWGNNGAIPGIGVKFDERPPWA